MKLGKAVLSLILCLCALLAAGNTTVLAEEAPGPITEADAGDLGDWLQRQGLQLSDELLDTLSNADLTGLEDDLSALLRTSSQLSDEALREAVVAMAADHGITLVDSQVQQLMDLCRALEKLDPDTNGPSGVFATLASWFRSFFQALKSLLSKLAELLRRLWTLLGF